MKILELEQGSDEWKTYRRSKITSTGMSSVLNLSPFRTAMEYWMEMVGLKPGAVMNHAMRRGMDSEDDARTQMYIDTAKLFEPKVILSDESPWLMSSLDGLSEDLKTVWEVKTPLEKNFTKMCDNPIPVYYNIQMQTTFAASDGVIESGIFSVYSPEHDMLHRRSVERDEKLIEKIIQESEIFWRRVREFDAPPPLHEVVETDEMRHAVDQAVLARDLVAKALKMKDAADNCLKVIARDRNIQGFGTKVTRYFRKGSVDYKGIPELKGVDLEAYRKPATENTRITIHG